MPVAYGVAHDLRLSAGNTTGFAFFDDYDPLGTYPAPNPYWAITVDPTQENTWGERGWELQDMSLIFKFLLHHDPCRERYISAGVQVLVAAGMGRRPLMAFAQVGIDVCFSEGAGSVREAVRLVTTGRARRFGPDHVCQGHAPGGCR